jgi:hypothetical protein
MPALLRLAVLLVLAGSVGCARSHARDSRPAAGPSSTATETKPTFEPWEKSLQETRRIDGMFVTHMKRDNALLLELAPSQLDRDYALALYFSQGISDLGINQGMPLAWETRLMNFRRVGDHIQLVHRNNRYTADDGSPMRTAVDASVGHSVVAAFKIISEHAESKHLLVDVTPLLLSDYGDVDATLKWSFNDRSSTLDRERSHVRRVQGFPENVEIDVELTFRAPPVANPGVHMVSDYRSIPVGVRYSFFDLPEQPMMPRHADPRVGHFVTSVYDYSYTGTRDPFLKYVNRWRLERQDAGSGLSEPVQPIVFYIDHSIPHELRPAVREGIEAWNKGFEAAGFRNAIVARDAPDDDDTWNPEDIRYSTIRWLADPWGWAIGPSDMDPRTGEILNADILISAGITNFYGMDSEFFGHGAAGHQHDDDDLRMPDGRPLPPALRARAAELCMAARSRAEEMRSQHLLLAGLGVVDGADPLPMEYVHGALRDLVMHEVGHSIGLRHNFRGSSAIPYDRLQDTAYTRRHGLSLSVMDYVPVNVAADPRQQGHYWNVEVGAYDVWAIQYAYAPVYVEGAGEGPAEAARLAATSEAERPALARIAARAAEPLHAYGTDEDVLGPFGVDPLTTRYDLSSDPLRWARDRAELAARLEPVLEQRLIRDGESYVRLRGGMSRLLSLRFSPLQGVARYVGGAYVARDHKGDPGQRPPFVPVPAAEQRQAVALIIEQAFAEDAFRYDPDLLNRLAPDRHYHWGATLAPPLDFPLHERAAALQNSLLLTLLAPPRLTRMVDNGARMPAGAESYSLHELFATLTTAIWAEAGRPAAAARNVNSFRRNLQRAHLDRMITLLTATPAPGQPAIPGDARASARHELVGLSRRLDAALTSPGRLDLPTRAHLAESRARIGRALDASVQVPPGR